MFPTLDILKEALRDFICCVDACGDVSAGGHYTARLDQMGSGRRDPDHVASVYAWSSSSDWARSARPTKAS